MVAPAAMAILVCNMGRYIFFACIVQNNYTLGRQNFDSQLSRCKTAIQMPSCNSGLLLTDVLTAQQET